MRILHTADWHHCDTLGDVTGPAMDFIVQQATEIKPDAIVIAGDLIVKRGFITPQEALTIRETVLRLAEVAPVLAIPGNHDISNRYDRVDAVTGLLARLRVEKPTLHDRLFISIRPECVNIPTEALRDVRFFTLPHPSKYLYLSREDEIKPSEIDSKLTESMRRIAEEFATECIDLRAKGIKPILVGHGTVSGGVADSEKVLTQENDLAIDRHWLAGIFEAIMYGHLHKRQSVGEIVYCGAIAPLTFGQEKMTPSFELWDFQGDSDEIVHRQAVEIPVAHQMLTVKVNKDQFVEVTDDPMDVVFKALKPIAIKDAKVRVQVEIHKERRSLLNRGMIEDWLTKQGVHSHKLVIDTVDPIRIRADDMDTDLDMEGMLKVWSELDDDRAASLPLMNEINLGVSAAIPPEVLHQLQGTNYTIKRIKATNFKPLIDVNINFDDLGSIICITGRNHAGKSQVAEIESFAFWKKLRKGTNLFHAIRRGCKETDVSIWFEAQQPGGQMEDFRVRRTLKLGTGDTASGTVVLSKQVGEQWLPINEGDAKETQVSIEKMVGSYEMYRSTRFGSQQDIDYLCSRTPAEMKDIFQEAMNFTAFDLRRKAAEEQLKMLRGDYENVTMKMENLGKELERESQIKDSLEQLGESKVLKTTELEDLRTQRGEIQQKINNAQALVQQRTALNLKSADFREKIEAEETTIRELIAVLEKKDQVTEGIQRQAALESEIEDRQAAHAKMVNEMQAHSTEQAALTNRRSGLISDSASHQMAIGACQQVIENDQGKHDNQVRDAKAAITRSEATAALTEEVPCNDMDFQSECKLLENANAAKTKVEGLKAALTGLEATPPDHSENEQTIKEKTSSWEKVDAEIATLSDTISSKQTAHQAKQRSFDSLDAELKRLRADLQTEKANDWPKVQERVAVADTNLKNTETNRDRLQAERLGVTQELEKLGESVDTIDLQMQLGNLNTNLTSMQIQYDETVRQIGVMQQSLERMETVKAALEGLKQVNSSGLAKINAFVHYIVAVSRDGIPYLLMEKALPHFARFANEFLCVDEGFDEALRVKIDPVKDTQSGKEKEAVVITFTDDRGTHPLGEASGFQRVAIGYSLRAAMAKIKAEATGDVINHCTFDEGWGAFDEPNLLLAKRMIQKLGDEFGKFIYITHVPVLQEVCDTTIHVESVDGGATVKIV